MVSTFFKLKNSFEDLLNNLDIFIFIDILEKLWKINYFLNLLHLYKYIFLFKNIFQIINFN